MILQGFPQGEDRDFGHGDFSVFPQGKDRVRGRVRVRALVSPIPTQDRAKKQGRAFLSVRVTYHASGGPVQLSQRVRHAP